MATFDRFGVCEAFYAYAVMWAGEKYAERAKARLDRLAFKPAPSLERGLVRALSASGRETYAKLVEEHHRETVGYTHCACRDCFETAIGVPEVAMCSDCEKHGCEHGEHECCSPHAYGGEAGEECE